jgi:hypothetical protein
MRLHHLFAAAAVVLLLALLLLVLLLLLLPLCAAELIEEARRRMQGGAGGRKDTSIVLEGLLGEGTFGKVYKGTLNCAARLRCRGVRAAADLLLSFQDGGFLYMHMGSCDACF